MASGKRNFKHYLIRSGWPQNIKSDCEYFNITYNDLAMEAGVTKYRITSIANGAVVYKTKEHEMKEMTYITEAFNRIIEYRQRKPLKQAWEW